MNIFFIHSPSSSYKAPGFEHWAPGQYHLYTPMCRLAIIIGSEVRHGIAKRFKTVRQMWHPEKIVNTDRMTIPSQRPYPNSKTQTHYACTSTSCATSSRVPSRILVAIQISPSLNDESILLYMMHMTKAIVSVNVPQHMPIYLTLPASGNFLETSFASRAACERLKSWGPGSSLRACYRDGGFGDGGTGYSGCETLEPSGNVSA